MTARQQWRALPAEDRTFVLSALSREEMRLDDCATGQDHKSSAPPPFGSRHAKDAERHRKRATACRIARALLESER